MIATVAFTLQQLHSDFTVTVNFVEDLDEDQMAIIFCDSCLLLDLKHGLGQ